MLDLPRTHSVSKIVEQTSHIWIILILNAYIVTKLSSLGLVDPYLTDFQITSHEEREAADHDTVSLSPGCGGPGEVRQTSRPTPVQINVAQQQVNVSPG